MESVLESSAGQLDIIAEMSDSNSECSFGRSNRSCESDESDEEGDLDVENLEKNKNYNNKHAKIDNEGTSATTASSQNSDKSVKLHDDEAVCDHDDVNREEWKDPERRLTMEVTQTEESDKFDASESTSNGVITKGERKAAWLEIALLIILCGATAVVATTIYRFSLSQEIQSYESWFDEASSQILGVLEGNSAHMREFFQSWSLHLTANTHTSEDAQWPFVTFPNFEMQGYDATVKTGALLVSIAPLVSINDRAAWEDYSINHQDWIKESLVAARGLERDLLLAETTTPTIPEISPFIFHSLDSPQNATAPLLDDLFLPLWQTAPILESRGMINFDALNFSSFPKVFGRVRETQEPVLLSGRMNALDPSSNGTPEALLAVPIMDSLGPGNNTNKRSIVALLLAWLRWEDYLVNLVPSGTPPLAVEIHNPCADVLSFYVSGPNVTFMGHKGLYDSSTLDSRGESYTHNFDAIDSVPGCEISIHIFPTTEFEGTYLSRQPIIYACVSVALFVVTATAFLIYDALIKKKHNRLIKAARLSNSLVRSLFPENVRIRLMGEQTQRHHSRSVIRRRNSNNDTTESKGNLLNEGSISGKPIADLFPHATVLFADIAGFTAWSSSRDPSQVFTLLESIYNSFDRIANKYHVFKVETIGDCYVAAAGLPDPRADHAAVMARFTVMCLHRFREVVRDLEVTLGPDTADLSLRAGLHSGPVTAGVLRGEKSRFQLFGDTVNVASRMESTGAPNRIHISQTTADMVISECNELSIRPRDHLIEVKGKGKMQTFFLLFESEDMEQQSDHISTGSFSRGFTRSSFAMTGSYADDFSSPLRRPSIKELSSNEKHERLIDWNVDVLQGLLKNVAAMRSSKSKKPVSRIAKMKIDREEGKMVIDEVQEVIEIHGYKADHHLDPSTTQLGQVVIAQLRDYVTCIATMYRNNHFHSFEHASHVTQSVIKLLGRIVAPEAIDYDNLTYKKKERAVLHFYTYGITSDPLTQFAVAFAALIHDVDHPGVPNATLVNEKTSEAIRYKNKSVAEQKSVDLAWSLLMKPDYVDLRACIYNSKRELRRFRQLVVNVVMATDIVDKELKALRNKRWDTAFKHTNVMAPSESNSDLLSVSSHHTTDPLDTSAEDMNRKATIVIEHLIQASDVSHTMQHWHVYQKWNQRFFFECYQGYLEGRSDVDPADGWYQGELGFFDYYIIPLAKKLKECGVFGVSSDEFLQYAESNRAEWQEKGQDLVEKYIAAYKEYVFGGFRRNMTHPP